MSVCFMCFILSSSSEKDAARVEHNADTCHIVPAVTEEPTEPDRVTPTSTETSGRAVLPLQPLLPSKPEAELPLEKVPVSAGKPGQQRADEEKPMEAVAGGQGSFANNKEPERKAENQLWATVEEKQHSENREEKDEKQEEGGVTGG